MDWGLFGVILAIVFFTVSVFLLFALIKKRRPVFVLNTSLVIGLGGDAPQEIELRFLDKPVANVNRTTINFFNRGNEVIRQVDVTEPVIFKFQGAKILRPPKILCRSNEAIKLSAELTKKDGCDAVEIGFLYLSHHDGAVIEVLHDGKAQVIPSGNIIGTVMKKIDDFEEPRLWFVATNRFLALLVAVTIGFAGTLMSVALGEIIHGSNRTNGAIWLCVGTGTYFLVMIILIMVPFVLYRTPGWSRQATH